MFRPTLGPVVCDWVEEYLCHGIGDIQGSPWVIDDEFRAHTYRAYELFPRGHHRAGRRVYKRDFLSRPKGRAKSELGAGIACAEFLGPVRFDGWDANGNPVGRPVTAPEILCLATEEGQAGNTFDSIVFMLNNGSVADEYAGLDVGLTRVFLESGGEITPVTSAATSKDGGKSTFAVADEVHLWVAAELHRLYNTVTRNITKRFLADGWLMVTSTMYAPGEGSVAEKVHESMAERVDEGVLFDHRQAPDDVDITDPEAIRRALIDLYGPAAEWTNIEGIVTDEFGDPTKSEADNRRYWFNQPHKRADRKFDPRLHKAAADRGKGIEVDHGTRIVVGFDGSEKRDATALVGWTVPIEEEELPYRFTLNLWEKGPTDGPEWRVPRAEVTATLEMAMAEFDVALVVCDPHGWHAEIDDWDGRWPNKVVEFDTRSPKTMTEAVDRYSQALADGIFSTDGDPDIERHLANAAPLKVGRLGSSITKPTAELKIDAAMATILGYWGLAHVPEDEGEPNIW